MIRSLPMTLSVILLLVLTGACTSTHHAVATDEAQGLRLRDENLKQPGIELTDAEIHTLLQDNVGAGGQADALVVGIVDPQGARVVSAGVTGGKTSRPADGDTLFRIGSVTKVFTGLLLQDMLERGEMNLDDPVEKYLPKTAKLPTRGGKQITLFDLAAHTSGLPRDWPDADRPETIDELYASLARLKLRHDPGSQWEYSNLAVSLLGHVICLTAKRDYETLVLERICQPLGMNSTRITLTPQLEARRATGHAFPGRPFAITRGATLMPGAGSLYSTANDLLKFLSASLDPTSSPLSPLMKKLQAVQQSDSGRRARLIWSEDSGVISHGGLVDGFRTNLGFDPAKRRGMVILANCSSSRFPPSFLAILLANRSSRPPKVASVDDSLLNQYTGQYRFKGPLRNAAVLDVQRIDNRLVLKLWHGQPPYPMPFVALEIFPQSRTVFHNQMVPITVTFLRDSSGQATVLLDVPREKVHRAQARKISAAPLIPYPTTVDPDLYDGFTGQYRPALFGMIPFGPTFNIYLKHDELGPHLMGYVKVGDQTTRGELFPYSPTILYSPDLDDCSLTFRRNKAQKAMSLVVQLPDREIRGVRVSDDPVLPDH